MSSLLDKTQQYIKKKREGILIALLFLLGVLVYAGSFRAGFLYDDYFRIVDNPLIKHFQPGLLWKQTPTDFVTNLTFALSYQVHRLNLIGWHAFSLALHFINAVLVYYFVRQVLEAPRVNNQISRQEKDFISLFSPFVFLLHPVQTQAVVYLVQRSTLLYCAFLISGLTFYLKARVTGESSNYTAAAVLVLLGTFTKPAFAVFPFAVLVCDIFLFEKREVTRASIAAFLVFCLPLVVIPAILLFNGTLFSEAVQAFGQAPFSSHWLTQPSVLFTYVRLFVFPVGLNLDYDFTPVSHVAQMAFWLPALFLLIMFIWGWVLRRKAALVSFAMFWIGATTSITAVFPLPDFIYEHWMYLPSIGFALILCFIIVRIADKQNIAASVMLAVLAACCLLTVNRVAVWSDTELLLQDVVHKSPQKARGHNNLGLVYLKKGKLKEAEDEFQKALSLDSRYHLAANNLALVYMNQGKFKKAEEIIRNIIMNYPENTDASVNLANILLQQGALDEAIKIAGQLERKIPFNPAVHIVLGKIYAIQGKAIEAESKYRMALWLNPQSSAALFNLGNLKYGEGSLYDALLYYKEALKIDPALAEAYNNIGHIYYFFHDFRQAVTFYSRATELIPESAASYFNLANALFASGQKEESRKMAQRAMYFYRLEGREDLATQIENRLKGLQ